MTKGKILPIVGYGSPILRKVCTEAEDNAESQMVIQSLLKTIMCIDTAVGLAAPQINSELRVFVLCPEGKHLVVINPTIKKSRGSTKSDECC